MKMLWVCTGFALFIIIFVYFSSDQFWPFLKCAVGYGESLEPSYGDECASKEGFDTKLIKSCLNGKLGHS